MKFIELQKRTKMFNLSEIERQLNIPRGLISKEITGRKKLSNKHLLKLDNYLKKHCSESSEID